MIRTLLTLSTLAIAGAITAPTVAAVQDHQHAQMKARGAQAMGFDQDKTTHHFRLLPDGGTIEVTTNDPRDTDSRDRIRGHLLHITQKFAAGDFSAPILTHAQTPPGSGTLGRLKGAITYKYSAIERGGRVRISTKNAEAVEAIHAFLQFQIDEHGRGQEVKR